MKWKDVTKDTIFIDNSKVIQKHQTHLYDTYTLEYEQDNQIKKITGSKDHLLKINIKDFPDEAKQEIKELCTGKIPLTEDLNIYILGNNRDYDTEIKQYIAGDIGNSCFDEVVEDFTDLYEYYMFTIDNTIIEAIVKRIVKSWENQKINDNEYWISLEGIAYLMSKYGQLKVGD